MLENGIYTILQAESILSNWQTHYSITCSPSPSVLYSQWREEFTERDWKQVALKHIFLFSELMVQQVRHNRGNATSQIQQSCILFTKSPKRWTAMQKSCDNRQIKDWMPPYGVFVFAIISFSKLPHIVTFFLNYQTDKAREINSIPELEGLQICVTGALPLTLLIQSPWKIFCKGEWDKIMDTNPDCTNVEHRERTNKKTWSWSLLLVFPCLTLVGDPRASICATT